MKTAKSKVQGLDDLRLTQEKLRVIIDLKKLKPAGTADKKVLDRAVEVITEDVQRDLRVLTMVLTQQAFRSSYFNKRRKDS